MYAMELGNMMRSKRNYQRFKEIYMQYSLNNLILEQPVHFYSCTVNTIFTGLLAKIFQVIYESRNADDNKYFCVVSAMLVVVVVVVS
jgi:hypothetical protein